MKNLPIKKETFVHADETTYRELEYDMLTHIWEAGQQRQEGCDKKYVRQSWFKIKLAFISGAISVISFVGVFSILKIMGKV